METHSSNGRRLSKGTVKHSPGGRKLPSPVQKTTQGDVVTNGDLGTRIGAKEQPIADSRGSGVDGLPTGDVEPNTEGPHQTSPRKAGVAYISEGFIRRIAREENLAQITTLNIMLGKDLNKKIKYLENLDGLKKLRVLSVSNHMVEKMEKLDKLTQLRELDLSYNCISKIEGLDSLVHLQVLNLSGNGIEHIPAGLFKKLREVQAFHIAHNRLDSLVEIARLRPLQDLATLSVEGNPLARLPHSRRFIIFQLRSLQTLDRMGVTDQERSAADERFGQEEVRRLEAELSKQERLHQTLSTQHQETSGELKNLKKAQSEQNVKNTQLLEKLKNLQHELSAKEELLKSKSAELSKACQKQFALEQELAFYKLDAKFEHLGKIPLPPDIQFGDDEDDESPYIGKAGFKPNRFTRDSFHASHSQTASVTPVGTRRSDRYDAQNKDIEHELHETLRVDLEEKEQAIRDAEEILGQLKEQLFGRRQQLQEVSEQLARIQQAVQNQSQRLGEEERKLVDAINEKKNYIRQLQEVAKDLEARMNRVLDDIKRKENDLDKVRRDLRNTSPDDAAYARLQQELAAKEQQLRDAKAEHQQLREDYGRAKERLREEIAALKRLEEQLAARGASAECDDVTDELRGLAEELTARLESAEQRMAQQQQNIADLQRENDGLKQKVRELRAHNVASLQQELTAAREALDKERKRAGALRAQLSRAEGDALQAALDEATRKLRDADSEAARLRAELGRLKDQLQADRQATDARIEKEQERVDRALQAAREAGDKERELRDMATQLDALQAANASLADRLQEAEEELDGQAEKSLDKADVLQRLQVLAEDIDRGRDHVRGQSGADEDLGRSLEDLQRKFANLMSALRKKRDRGEADKKAADAELQTLAGKLQDAEDALGKTKDHATQLANDNDSKDDLLMKMAGDLRKLKEKLAKQPWLEDELERLKAAHEKELGNLRSQIAQLKDQLKRAKHAVEEELASARTPLQAKIRDLEDQVRQLQRKLGKARAENDKLNRAKDEDDDEKRRLNDKLNHLADKLNEAELMAEDAAEGFARERRVLEAKIEALQDEVERLREKLRKLQDDAEDKLVNERAASAAKMRGLEDELDRLKDKMGALKDQAEDAAKSRDMSARQLKALEDEIEALSNELGKARAKNDIQLRKARDKEAALEALLGEKNDELQDANSRAQAHQARVRSLQDQIDDLRRSLQEVESQALKEKYEKELDAARTGRRLAATQEVAAEQLADTQRQIASLQDLLGQKDRQLQEQIRRGMTGASKLGSQRDDIRNLASALSAQNAELERLKAELARIGGPRVPSLTALANEVEALRSALRQREQEIQSVLQPLGYDPVVPHGTPHRTGPFPPVGVHSSSTTPVASGSVPLQGLATEPLPPVGGSLAMSAGEVHHHHHFSKKKRRRSKTPISLDASPVSPEVLGSAAVMATPSIAVHHHHYDELPENREKQERDLFCNVPSHEEYEVGHLEGMLTSTLQEARKNERETLRSDLRQLEDEVNDALRQRASSKRSHPHSLDGTLARFQDHLLTMLDHKTNLVSS